LILIAQLLKNIGLFSNQFIYLRYYPSAQSFLVKLPLNPVAATSSNSQAFGLGTVGVLLNGVSLYNANDRQS
jgi:hypothetical protein